MCPVQEKNAGVPVGEAYIGRVVNALGEAIDGRGEIKQMTIARSSRRLRDH